MTYKTLTVLAALGLSACMETDGGTLASADGALTTRAAFDSAIVGKTLNFNGNRMVINADGTISGPWDGSGITGTWRWSFGSWCREIAIGGVDRGPDCQNWSVDGNVATVTRDRGNGSSFRYTIS